MKKYLLMATALAALASCTSNEFVGDEAIGEANGQAAISFNTNVPAATRADKTGSAAASDLGNQFIVYGEKNSDASDDKTAPAEGRLVFQNYQVNWTTNTANTSTSNTKDWEYVGYTHSSEYQSNIKTKDGTTEANALTVPQTIKYWDYSAGSYTFTAVSAKQDDITGDKIKIQKNTSSGNDAFEKGYTITVANGASLDKLFFSDRKVITQTNGTDRTATNAYGGNVTFNFRNVLSHVRVGIYETIPGYDISAIKFYVDNGSGEQTTEAKVGSEPGTSAFGAICPNIKNSGYTGTLTVTYEKDGSTKNQPIVSASGTASTNLILGTNTSTLTTTGTPKYLGTSATSPTWDTAEGDFTAVMPQAGNNSNLKLKCDYTLYNSVTKEKIDITGKTAEIPAKYLCWKPNYKYTYLFKISDNDLYPITFDAVEIEAADGQAEYITTVSEPSITTFGVKDNKYTTGKNEYETGTDIYITIVQGHNVVNPVFMGDVHLYKVTTTGEEITEATVANAFLHSGGNITYTHKCSEGSKVTKVPAEDGTEITMNAIKLVPTEAGVYAIRYTPVATAATYNGGTQLDVNTSLANYYEKVDNNYIKCEELGHTTADGNTTYYQQTAAAVEETPVYKVIKVVAAP